MTKNYSNPISSPSASTVSEDDDNQIEAAYRRSELFELWPIRLPEALAARTIIAWSTSGGGELESRVLGNPPSSLAIQLSQNLDCID